MSNIIVNSFNRQLDKIFGHMLTRVKHDHYKDFGWPQNLSFDQFKRMYDRNSLAAAAVDKTVAKTWETFPEIWESEKAAKSKIEEQISKHFRKIKLWRGLMTADRRSLVGRYSAVILLLADGKPLSQPVEGTRLNIEDLVGVIPVWENQIRATKTISDPTDRLYGRPEMFEYREVSDTSSASRNIAVHRTRVIIWSEDGLMDGASLLQAGYNDLLDAEKVRGSGGEGFWKTSRGAPIIEASQGLKPSDVAKNMGVDQSKLLDKINDQLEQFQQGFDKGLMLGGMTATPLTISLPQPEEFHSIPTATFAASIQMPVRILLGNQTGERASTEDAKEWAKVNMARRVNYVIPCIDQLIEWMVEFGMLKEGDWTVGWGDLTDSTALEKIEQAGKMADINSKSPATELPVFTPDEIREVAGYEPLEDVDPEFVRGFTDRVDDLTDDLTDDPADEDDPKEPPQKKGQNDD